MSDVVKPPPCTEVWVLELKVRAGASRANQANTVIDQEGGPQIARAKVVRMSSQLRALASIASLLREAELSARPAALMAFRGPPAEVQRHALESQEEARARRARHRHKREYARCASRTK
jgi:hypothetical protein